jgi:hypothetical protein
MPRYWPSRNYGGPDPAASRACQNGRALPSAITPGWAISAPVRTRMVTFQRAPGRPFADGQSWRSMAPQAKVDPWVLHDFRTGDVAGRDQHHAASSGGLNPLAGTNRCC